MYKELLEKKEGKKEFNRKCGQYSQKAIPKYDFHPPKLAKILMFNPTPYWPFCGKTGTKRQHGKVNWFGHCGHGIWLHLSKIHKHNIAPRLEHYKKK